MLAKKAEAEAAKAEAEEKAAYARKLAAEESRRMTLHPALGDILDGEQRELDLQRHRRRKPVAPCSGTRDWIVRKRNQSILLRHPNRRRPCHRVRVSEGRKVELFLGLLRRLRLSLACLWRIRYPCSDLLC